MIRRDYLLRMIEEFARVLARLVSLKKDQRWSEATELLDTEFQRLIGEGAQATSRLSETELLARLMQGEPTQAVRQKTFILTTLLREAGDAAAAQQRIAESQECYLKALHLLLETLAQGEPSDCPEFVPRVESLRDAIGDRALPMRTRAMLMLHYERTGELARAEDAFFSMLDAEPHNLQIVDFGLIFFQRLLAQSDAVLTAAHLPRPEVEAAVQELQSRRQAGQTGVEDPIERK